MSSNLERIINEAQERLILISPYLKINDRLRQWLEDKDRFKIDIRVIYRTNDLKPAENNWLRSMLSIRSSYCENLHAKCYLNESEALVTSMNLYEYSQQNNEEMGILVKKSEDPILFQQIYDDANRLIRISKELQIKVEEVKPKAETKSTVKSTPAAKRSNSKGSTAKQDAATAHCIGCNTLIPFAMDRPYCLADHRSWNKDKDNKETYCHSCGKERDTSFNSPMCSDHDKPWFRKKKSG